jgi:hypothetical protein
VLTRAAPWLVFLLCVALYLSGSIGRLLVAGGVVLFAPGALLWFWLGRDLRLPRFAMPTLWLGLSLSLIPILFLWSSTLALRLHAPVIWLLAAGVLLLVGWRWLRSAPPRRVPPWLIGGWAVLLGLTGLTRVLHIRGMTLPPWVDPLHHTLLVRIVGETGRIPTSLQPYVQVDQLTYHWGYHTIIATWQHLASLPLAPMLLWSGQILNTLIVVAMYGLGAWLLRSPRAGLIAALVAGLLSLMPAMYVTWGRYTQLAGLLLLPGLLIVSVALVERRAFAWRLSVALALLLAGMALIHYRVLAFYVAFMVAYGTLLLLRQPRRALAGLGRLVVAGIVAGALAGPWLAVMIPRIVIPLASVPSALVGSDGYNSVDRDLLLRGNSTVLYALAALATILALWTRRWRVLTVAGWVGMLIVLANPSLVGLRSTWFINNHAMTITLFVPIALLVAACVDHLLRWRIVARRGRSAPAVAFVVVALFGAWQLSGVALPATWPGAALINRLQPAVINSATVLARPGDLTAIEWAARNLPPDARFLVNSTSWIDGTYRGTDGGWWLLPLAGRWTTTPPVLYSYGDPAYRAVIEALNQQAIDVSPTEPEQLRQFLRDHRITHIFIGGAQQGPFQADVLLSDPNLLPIYNADGAVILAVRSIP